MTIQNIYATSITTNHLHKTKFIGNERNKNILIIRDFKTLFLAYNGSHAQKSSHEIKELHKIKNVNI